MRWLLAVAACVVACAEADRGGSSLRGALEALQRRQRARGPILPQPDYDAFYEYVPPRVYSEPDYPVDVEDLDDEPNSKYLVKLIDQDPRPVDSYEYKLYKKSDNANSADKKESAFRERSHHSDNERLRDLFMDKSEVEEQKPFEDGLENDAEYALLLGQLWSKYKYNKEHGNNLDNAQQGVVKLYKEKAVKKRYPDNWGPIAFKRKRSSNSDTDRPVMFDYDLRKAGTETTGPNYNSYDLSDDDKDDLKEEYAIAFQPLDDDNVSDLADDEQYIYDTVEKRFPVTKRSSGPYMVGVPKRKNIQSQNKREVSKKFRSSAGTDPKIIRDLSEIFGGSENDVIKSIVKRSSDDEEHEHGHEVKPPMITSAHNNTREHNNSSNGDDDNSHEHHHLNVHHPGISRKDADHEHIHSHEDHHDHDKDKDKPLNIRKKSIDWSDYFGIDKRSKLPVKFVNDLTENRLRKQYYDTFDKEVLHPLNSFHVHNNVKRNYVKVPNQETEIQIDRAHLAVQKEEKRNSPTENDSKLDNIDKKLRNMEGMIVDEALHYSNVGEELDSKEEQEMKEKLLSRLAAAYSLEKMRKALKEFRHSLQIQKTKTNAVPSPTPSDDSKAKRVAIKKEKVDMMNNEIPGLERINDFEEEQGAGHYLNGKTEEHFSEGYMGGSGRHRIPVMSTAGTSGSCPVLGKIVQRCRGVDLLAGDRGQLFLPLCSLHQICYLCGAAPPTTCDLVFLSEADTTCEGDMSCQRAARSALMALRELHDNLADELDGECEANPCLPATLKLNLGWQRAFQR